MVAGGQGRQFISLQMYHRLWAAPTLPGLLKESLHFLAAAQALCLPWCQWLCAGCFPTDTDEWAIEFTDIFIDQYKSSSWFLVGVSADVKFAEQHKTAPQHCKSAASVRTARGCFISVQQCLPIVCKASETNCFKIFPILYSQWKKLRNQPA